MTWLEKARAALKKGDTVAATAALDEVPEKDREDGKAAVVIHNHTAAATRDRATCDAEEEEEKEKEKEKKTHDALDARLSKVEDGLATMSKDVKTIKDAILDAAKEDEEEEKEKKTEDAEKIDALEFEAPPGTTHDAAIKWKDSRQMEESFQETVSLAEIITPGVRVPTFDAKAKAKDTFQTLCSLRRRVLDAAFSAQPETRFFMEEVMAGRTMDAYTCDGIRTLFRAVGLFKKNRNNGEMAPRSLVAAGTRDSGVKPLSLAELNKRNREFYKG